jgi:hypothetical protein
VALEGSAALQADDDVPGSVVGEVARSTNEAEAFIAGVVGVPEHPELRMEEMTRSRSADLMNHGLQEGE